MNVKLRKGFDINLVGKAEKSDILKIHADVFTFKPTDFHHIKRPKVLVKEGDVVKAGTPIFIDKFHPEIKHTSPVSGEVVSVVFGERRVPLQVKILADKQVEYVQFEKFIESQIESLDKTKVQGLLFESGLWTTLTERPFGLIPNPEHEPKAIFISAFDSSPLAPDYDFVFKNDIKYLQAGIHAIQKLTKGKIHLSVRNTTPSDSVFRKLKGLVLHEFTGKHPVGNVGVQIHHINPINKGDYVWTTSPYGLLQIGKLFLEGVYDSTQTITITGSEIKKPQYVSVRTGTQVSNILKDNLKQDNVRVVSGNVLTGEKIEKDGFLGFHHHQITVIPEGNYHEFFGWLMPSFNKLSFTKALGLFSFLNYKREFVLDSNTHGEERAFVQTGVFEKVLPMDVLPVHLLKSILANDFEEMEALGIFEVLEEDFALCEFVDVSKLDVQNILREGMEAYLEA